MKRNNIKYLFTIVALGFALQSFAQRDTSLTQEVEVSKAFKPTIAGADKINDMPKIEDAGIKKPNFNYSIFSQPLFNTSAINNLKAATMANKPKENNGYGLVRAGMGSYYKPYGEVFFNSQNTKSTLFGLHGRHLSSYGKVNLYNGDRVKAPFMENDAEMFIKHLFDKSVLSVTLNYDYDGFRYYGLPESASNPTLYSVAGPDIYFGQKQFFSKGGININLVNSIAGPKDPKFDFDFKYHYFATKTGQKEHFSEFTANVRKPFVFGTGVVEASAAYALTDKVFNRLLLLDRVDRLLFMLKPGIYFGGDIANIKIGVGTWFLAETDLDVNVKIAPDIRVNFIPVKEIINIYAGVDGYMNNNYYSKIAYENPYVNPMHNVENDFVKIHAYGGFDGKFATKTNFKLSADYSIIGKQPYYYQFGYRLPTMGPMPSPLRVDNTFDVLYDKLNLLKLNLEIFHASSEKVELLLAGSYYSYKTDKQKVAWNMPRWDAKMVFGYKLTERLNVSTNFILVGKRQSSVSEITGFDFSPRPYDLLTKLPGFKQTAYDLKTIADLNLVANYKITQKFNVFGQLNNFAFQKYQRWLGYPVQNFNFLGGLSYSF